MTTTTDPASVIGRAFELAAEADAEADQYARQRQEDYEQRLRANVRDHLADVLPDLEPHATITTCPQTGGPDAIVTIGDPDAPLARFDAYRPMEGGSVSLYLAMPCPACSNTPERGPMVGGLTDLGIALRTPVPSHPSGPVYVEELDETRHGRCDGTTVTFQAPPKPHVPPAEWRVANITSHQSLVETLNALTEQGYEVMWPPLMDGHVLVARHRS